MNELNHIDMNTLSTIAYSICLERPEAAKVLLDIHDKASKMIRERDIMFTNYKEVNVTNLKNVLVQVPRIVAAEWNLQVGDKLEVAYNGDILTVRPAVHRRGDTATQSN